MTKMVLMSTGGAGSIDQTAQKKFVQSAERNPNIRKIEPPHWTMMMMRKAKVTGIPSQRRRRSMMRDWRGRKMNDVKLNVRMNLKESESSMQMMHKARTVCASKVGRVLISLPSILITVILGRGRMKYVDPEVHQRHQH